METQIVYVLVSSDNDYYLEELWVSLYSLRHFHPTERVLVLADAPTAERISQRPSLCALITETLVIHVPKEFSGKHRSREIKTSIRNLIDGDFLFIDTDTVITQPLCENDFMSVKNIAMVPEMHGPFTQHLFYKETYNDVKRIFNIDVSDSPYWFNSGCMFVKDNQTTRAFFKKWNENWKHSAFKMGNSSDQRALLCTDKIFGYIIECLPDVYNCQVAMSIQYFYEAKIVHFWHMRSSFTSDLNYSPFCNKKIYQQIKSEGHLSDTTSKTIINCKNSFATPSMLVGNNEIKFLFSPTGQAFCQLQQDSQRWSTLLDWVAIKIIRLHRGIYKTKQFLKKKK